MKFTKKQIEEAKAEVARKNCSVDVQLSPRIYATFGTQGMCVTKCDGTKSGQRKRVSRWRIKTASEINAELDAQQWQKEE